MTPFIGVRNSCDILARNSLLAWLAACSRAHGFFQLIGTVFDSLLEQPLLFQQRLLRCGQGSIMPLKLSPRNSTSSPVLLTWIGSSWPFRADVMPA